MAQTQFLGWAPPPRQMPGQYNWFGPAMQGYQQGLESQRQRMDMTNMTQPGYVPRSKLYGPVYAQQQMQTPLQEAQTGYYDERTKLLQNPVQKPTPEMENAKKTYLIDLDKRFYEEKKLSRPEYMERVNKIERFFRSPEGMQATPQQIEAFYVGLEPTTEKRESLGKRLARAFRNTGVIQSPGLQIPKTQSKYKIGQPVKGPDGKNYKVVGFDTDGEPLVEPL